MDPSVIDTLRYADRLKAAGVETRQAEAMARALNDELAGGVATKGDLDGAVGALKGDLDRAVGELKGEMGKLHSRVDGMEAKFEAKFEAMETRFDAMDTKLGAMDTKFDAMESRFDAMEVRFNAMETRFEAMDTNFHALGGRFETQGRYVFLVLGLIAALGLYNAVAPRLPAAAAEVDAAPVQSARAQAAGPYTAPA